MAHEFFYDALTCLNPGGTIHLYTICERDQVDLFFMKLSMQARSMGSKITIDRLEELKTYSPSMSVYSADIRFAELDLVEWWEGDSFLPLIISTSFSIAQGSGSVQSFKDNLYKAVGDVELNFLIRNIVTHKS